MTARMTSQSPDTSGRSRTTEHWAPRFLIVIPVLVATALTARRFEFVHPSLIDDWEAYRSTFDDVITTALAFGDEGARFRPSWETWQALSWWGVGGDGSILPSVWNVGRVLILVVGLYVLTNTLIELESPKLQLAHRHVLAALVPLLLVVTPYVAVDLARLGPQEPMLIGGMAVGAAVMVRSVRTRSRVRSTTTRIRWLVAVLIGLFLWSIGTYHKEVSVAVLAMVPFVGWRIMRARNLKATTLALGVLALIPVLHVLAESLSRTYSGNVPYAGGSVVSVGDILERSVTLFRPWPTLHRLSLALFALNLALLTIAYLRARRLDTAAPVVSAGLFAVAISAHLLAAQSGGAATRYVLPPLALMLMSMAVIVGIFGGRAVSLAGVAAVVAAAVAIPSAASLVAAWAEEERAFEQVVSHIAARDPATCTVLLYGRWDVERTAAIPVVLIGRRSSTPSDCEPAIYVWGGDEAPPPPTEVCAGDWEQSAVLARATVSTCPGVARTQHATQFVRTHRVVPGGDPPSPAADLPAEPERELGYCLDGRFLQLPESQVESNPAYSRAVIAIFVAGKGITCDPPPHGFVRKGWADSKLGVPPDVYPYFDAK